MEKLANVQDI